jgi:hypothetical protein
MALLAFFAGGSVLRAQESGPRQILITYRCAPADRANFRNYLETNEMALLEKLKKEGTLEHYRVLFNPVISETYDALLVMDFHDYAATDRWLDLERSRPGGLDAAGLRLAKPQQTYFADLQWSEATEAQPSSKSVFYVIPYDYKSLDQYKAYIDGYLIPQVKGWLKTGTLRSYSIYLNRYNVGPPWDSLFIYEYQDLESFGRRAETITKVRNTLRPDPTWKHWSDIKETIRSEEENTIMVQLFPKPSAHQEVHSHTK